MLFEWPYLKCVHIVTEKIDRFTYDGENHYLKIFSKGSITSDSKRFAEASN